MAFAAALGVRAGIVFLHAYGFVKDAHQYQTLALNLLHHGTLSTALEPPYAPSPVRPPVVPAFAALIEALTGPSLFGIQVLQIVLSAVAALVLARAVGRWVPSAERAVLWSLCLLPFDGFYCGALLSETLSAVLMALAMALLLSGRGRLKAWAASGALFGLLTLTRDVYLVFPGLIAAGLIVMQRPVHGGWLRRARLGGVLVAAQLAVVAPWTLRNTIDFHRFIPITKGYMGFTVWVGTWERDGSWVQDEYVFPRYAFWSAEEAALVQDLSRRPPPDSDKEYLRLALDHIRTAPVQTALVWVERSPKMWFGTRSDLFKPRFGFLSRGAPAWYLQKIALWAINAIVLTMGFAGMLLPWRGKLRTRLLLRILGIPVLATALVYFPLHNTENRYSHPVLQFLIVSAAVVATHAWNRFRASRYPSKATPVVLTSSTVDGAAI